MVRGRGHGPNTASGPRNWDIKGNRFSPEVSRRNLLAQPTRGVLTSDLQNCERVNLSCFRSVSLW